MLYHSGSSWPANHRLEARWLIVYDNAEDPALIRQYWPVASHGQAIITARNRLVAFELADDELEILNWDNDSGLKFLLHLLRADITTRLEDKEIDSAHQLSEELRGHALAISTMAGLIHRRSLSISEFMRFYTQHQGEVLGCVHAVWNMSFQELDAQARTVLGVMSFVSPDSIPQGLFEPESTTDLPPSLGVCADPSQ
jgi:hypothetical protein